MPKFKRSIFVFRRDLRLTDNTGLIAALEESESVLPCFIYDQRQLESNPYRADNCVQFMLQSLAALDRDLQKIGGRLYRFYGIAEEVLERLLSESSFDALYLNLDYTPFSRKRDDSIAELCKNRSVQFKPHHDLLLATPGSVVKADGSPYTVYTPFYKTASKQSVIEPRKLPAGKFERNEVATEVQEIEGRILAKTNPKLALVGGRPEALAILKNLKAFAKYDDTRNIPANETGTTRLSAHNKFGTVSVREVYHAVADHFGPAHILIKELYWRDFFTHIAFFFPHVFLGAFYKQYDRLTWRNDQSKFAKWCDGQTGFPIVDAGMRQLNQTGYMHNRVRMIVASFLTKDLHIDWRWGEKYFAQKLIDYDPAVNNGNWQWAASTGCDAAPYFRIFNPWLQQKKFDPECAYIKQWVPELSHLPSKQIHSLHDEDPLLGYAAPMIDHSIEKVEAEAMFHRLKKNN